ncbi:hypothetical protein [Defluviimonas salinarum]|uniref:Porin n=1 Tax=Defluviimonas salinarum TaxID=2992147 RepID=A0ABT3J9R3_9RHOB|nr:hypothetical protein [Defluviimonas salinarum]MCW3784442.1 hypothetical protein [Defluviimonas salinarum]
MTRFPRIALGLAMAATAIASLSGMASAEGMTATGFYETARIETPLGDKDYDGLRFDIDGDHASGVVYEVKLRAGDLDGVAMKSIDTEMAWHYRDLVGPKLSYSHAVSGGAHAEETLAGLSGKYDLANGIGLYGDAMTDLDNFGDDLNVSLGSSWAANDDLTLWGEIENASIGTDSETGTIGATYRISGTMHVDGRVALKDTDAGVSMKGAAMGLGFSF